MCESIAKERTGTRGIGAETAPIDPPGISNSELSLNDPNPESSAISVRRKQRGEIAEVGKAAARIARFSWVASGNPLLSSELSFL